MAASLVSLFTFLAFTLSTVECERLLSQVRQIPRAGVPELALWCSDGVILCHSDLGGYYTCVWEKDEWGSEDWVLSPLNRCREGTRCGCQLNGDCKRREQDVCVPVVKPYPFPQEATYYGKGKTFGKWYAWDKNVEVEKEFGLWSVVKQNATEGKFLQIITDERFDRKRFELIVPDGNGKYIKFSGTETKCTQETIPSFQPFGYDISNHLRKNSTRGGNGKRREVWDYELGFDANVWVVRKGEWTISADDNVRYSTPVTSFHSEASRQSSIVNQLTSWRLDSLEAPLLEKQLEWYKTARSDNWFQIPRICLIKFFQRHMKDIKLS